MFSALLCVSCRRSTYSPVQHSVLVHSANSAGEPGAWRRPDMVSQTPGEERFPVEKAICEARCSHYAVSAVCCLEIENRMGSLMVK